MLVVTAAREVRIRRAMARGVLDREAVEARMAAQLAQEESVRRADFVIDNSGSEEELRHAVAALYRRLTAPSPG